MPHADKLSDTASRVPQKMPQPRSRTARETVDLAERTPAKPLTINAIRHLDM